MVGNTRIFLQKGTKKFGSAASRYVEQLTAVVSRHETELKTHMEVERFNPYGLWKGAATFATSGTTMSPSVPAIARRGEWSIGGVLDCY